MKGSIIYLFLFALFSSSTWGQDQPEFWLNMGDSMYSESPSTSYHCCLKAKELLAENSDPYTEVEINLCLGRYHILVTQYDDATELLNRAIQLAEETNNLPQLSAAYSLKSILLERVGNLEDSRNLLRQSIAIDREMGDSSSIRIGLINLSLGYIEADKLDSAKLCLEELELLSHRFSGSDFYYYYQNLGFYYLESGNIDNALTHFDLALSVAEKEKMTDSKATIYVFFSKAYQKIPDLQKALEFAHKSRDFSKENELLYEESEALGELTKVYQLIGDFESAYEMQREWIRVKEEIVNEEKLRRVEEMENALALSEKEKTIALSKAELQEEKIKTAEANERNAWLYGIVSVVLVLLAFTAYVFLKTKRLNAQIQEQKKEVEIKSANLEEALDNIHDSLEYSKLIQEALLPSSRALSQAFPEHAILFLPKDIVSGDFYWLHEDDEQIIVAVGDCTGHGVPGAMVSMVCHEALNKVVKELGVKTPNEILDRVRSLVIRTFGKQEKSLRDGMDIALCSIPKTNEGESKTVRFAGANNPLWILRKQGDQIEDLKGDKQPIGKYGNPVPFNLHEANLNKGDTFYLFSDGYADQFGGEKGKKFKSANLKKLFISIRNERLEDQREMMKDMFDSWRGDLEQIDDVCVMAIRL